MNEKHALTMATAAAAGIGRGLIDLLYPPHCHGCETPLDRDTHKHLCNACRDSLPFISRQMCPTCGHELAEFAAISKRCPACTGKTLNFRSASAPFRYEDLARTLILQFKLLRRHWLASLLSDHLANHLQDLPYICEIDAIASVPIHWRRYMKRGYNQAHLLAVETGKRLGLPVLDALKRTANTRTQTAVGKAGRMANMLGIFRMRKKSAVKGRRILLIDDVMTTCATCAECSRVLLREGGARNVHVAVVARTHQQA